MPRRWQRRRRDRDDVDEARPSDGQQPAAPDDDLESRLGPVTSRFDRPPTAEELRAAFSRRPPTQEDEPAPPPPDDFASRYPTESLFVATPVDDEPAVEEPAVDDRSRTTGDYYYDPEDAWAVLGLSPGAPWTEIAATHRRLAMQHHPDRLLGASDAERARSEETMREINVAYSVLRRLTGR